MDARYVLALDQGTTSSRALVFDATGRIAGVSQREFTQHFPQPGWVEHDATEIWQLTLAVLDEVARAIDRPVAAIGVTNQRETVVAWDLRTGRPVHRAIVWQDRRTASRCDELAPSLALIRARTGLVLDPYFSATKIEWLLRNGALDAADLAFGTVDSWITWKLTGGARRTQSLQGTLATVRRPDGGRQVTYRGRLLYSFKLDKPGKVTGDGFKDAFGGQKFTWHVARPAGEAGSSPGAATARSSDRSC